MQAPFADPLSGLELPSKTLPLLGREAEMQTIRALLDTVALNQPIGARALMINGQPGVGKSRLLAEINLEARARGFRVLEGHTYESGNMFPYLPFIEALRPVLRSSTPEALRRYMGLADSPDPVVPRFIVGNSFIEGDLSEAKRSAFQSFEGISLTGTPLLAALARLFPELAVVPLSEATRFNPPLEGNVTITPEILSPEQEKFRLFDAVATLLERMAMEQPVLLAIDNLQWADSGSLELTMYLTVRLHNSHVALLGVTRLPAALNRRAGDDNVAPPFIVGATAASIATARALGDLMRHGLLLLLPLGPLDAEAAEQHLHALLPGTLSQELAQALLGRAEGNPFFLEELVRTLTVNQVLALRDGEWRATRSINAEIPQSITLAVEQRLLGLSTACRELLRTASLFGRTFPLDALVQALEVSEDEVQALIHEAMQAAVIAKPTSPLTPGSSPQRSLRSAFRLRGSATILMFCQGVVQEVLSAEVPTSRARWLHGAIGVALEASYADVAPAYAAELAHHYALSGNKEATLRWSLLAGEDAARQQTHREAIGHFRLVLRLLGEGTIEAREEEREEKGKSNVRYLFPSPAQLHLLIGESWFKLGELEQAALAFQQVLPSVKAASSVLQPQTGLVQGASAQVDIQGALLLAHANRLLADVYRMQGKYDQALAHLQAASNAFDAMSNAGRETNATLDEPTQVCWFPGRSFPTGTRSLASASPHPLVPANERVLLLQAQATLDIMLDRTQKAETALWQSHQLATEIGDRGSQAFALQLLGWLRGWGKHIHEAIRLQEQAHELYVAIGDPFRAALVDQVLGIVYQTLGEMERARLCTLRGFERARRYGAIRILGLLHWNFGVMALVQGDWTGSDSRLRQAWQEAEMHNDVRLKPVVLQAQAELHFRQGNWREAEQYFQASVKAASTTEWIASAIALYGHFLAVTGRRKAAQEQLDRAAAYPEPPGLAGSFYIPFLAEGYIHLGANERATAYIERIRSMRGFMYYGTSVDRVLGVVATLAGDWETAAQAFEHGLALCQHANNGPEEAAILYEQARAVWMRVGTLVVPPFMTFYEPGQQPGEVKTTGNSFIVGGLNALTPVAGQEFITPAQEPQPTSPAAVGLRENIDDLCDRARALFLRYHMQRAADLVHTFQQGVRVVDRRDDRAALPAIPPMQPRKQVAPRFIVGVELADRLSTLPLTARELEVLRLVAEGHTDREVAEILVISPRTVNRHLSNIFVKLDVPGRAAAVAYAIRQGIVS